MTTETRRGTDGRVGRYIRDDCEREGCTEKDVLVYDAGEQVVCAHHRRVWAKDHPRVEECDECGATPAWRDPVTRRNEFFCAQCHARHGTVFQNRWAPSVRNSEGLGVREKVECAAADRGTECKGEKKWRGEFKMILCNKHAGKKSNGPEWHQ